MAKTGLSWRYIPRIRDSVSRSDDTFAAASWELQRAGALLLLIFKSIYAFPGSSLDRRLPGLLLLQSQQPRIATATAAAHCYSLLTAQLSTDYNMRRQQTFAFSN